MLLIFIDCHLGDLEKTDPEKSVLNISSQILSGHSFICSEGTTMNTAFTKEICLHIPGRFGEILVFALSGSKQTLCVFFF